MVSSQPDPQSMWAQRSEEVFVIDPQRMTLIYRGGLNSPALGEQGIQQGWLGRNYLEEVL